MVFFVPWSPEPTIIASDVILQQSDAGATDIVTHSSEQPRALLERLSSEGIEHVYAPATAANIDVRTIRMPIEVYLVLSVGGH